MGTVSAGIAFSPDNGVDFMTLYKKANMVLCKAKKIRRQFLYNL